MPPFEGKSIPKIIAWVNQGVRPPLVPTEWSKCKTLSKEKKAVLPRLLFPPPTLRALIKSCWLERAIDRPTVAKVFTAFQDEVCPAVKALTGEIGASPTESSSSVMYSTSPGDSSSAAADDIAVMGVGEFLRSAGLEAFECKLQEHGFTDVETLSDREILDDQTLAKDVGMSKSDIRKLRGHITAKGTSPTMAGLYKNGGSKGGKGGGMGGLTPAHVQNTQKLAFEVGLGTTI